MFPAPRGNLQSRMSLVNYTVIVYYVVRFTKKYFLNFTGLLFIILRNKIGRAHV